MNTMTVCGRLTADSEVKNTDSGKTFLRFRLASDVGFGEHKHAIFLTVTNWRNGAGKLSPYLTKGVPVTVSGEFDCREFERKDGMKGHALELNADRVEIQGSKPAAATGVTESSHSDNARAYGKLGSEKADTEEGFDGIPF